MRHVKSQGHVAPAERLLSVYRQQVAIIGSGNRDCNIVTSPTFYAGERASRPLNRLPGLRGLRWPDGARRRLPPSCLRRSLDSRFSELVPLGTPSSQRRRFRPGHLQHRRRAAAGQSSSIGSPPMNDLVGGLQTVDMAVADCFIAAWHRPPQATAWRCWPGRASSERRVLLAGNAPSSCRRSQPSRRAPADSEDGALVGVGAA